jgi:hypothetical protein
MEETTEIQELSLEKLIDTKLVQNNVTKAVIAALKDKYGGLKLKSVDDKESYLEIKAAKREVAKVRTLAVKTCKEGREEANKISKGWIAKEKEVVGEIAEVEDSLDAEIDKFDAEVERLANEEKERQETAYINRQAQLTKLGATYQDGSFVLGEASFEGALIKGCSQDVWEEAVVPKFQAEYEQIEAVKVAEQRKKAEEEAAMRAEQEKLRAEQEAFRKQQEEFNRQQAEAARIEKEKALAEQVEKDRIAREEQFELMKKQAAEAAEAKRLADIELAVQKEKERQEFAALQAEQNRKLEAARIAEELAQSSDKVKYADLIAKLTGIDLPEMRSGQYRKKVQLIREKIEEILSL